MALQETLFLFLKGRIFVKTILKKQDLSAFRNSRSKILNLKSKICICNPLTPLIRGDKYYEI